MLHTLLSTLLTLGKIHSTNLAFFKNPSKIMPYYIHTIDSFTAFFSTGVPATQVLFNRLYISMKLPIYLHMSAFLNGCSIRNISLFSNYFKTCNILFKATGFKYTGTLANYCANVGQTQKV